MTKRCYKKEFDLLQWAKLGIISVLKDNTVDADKKSDIEPQLQDIMNRITKLVEIMPKNCINPGHYGGCLIFCDCGCLGSQQCRST